MSQYESIPQFKKMLANLDRWLVKGVEFARTKSFDESVLVGARLAPDQYPLTRQIQGACDSAKSAAARLTGKEQPKHPDTEQTVDQLRKRIKTVQDYLDTFTAADFNGSEKREILLPFLEGKALSGSSYLTEMVLPNFYFHVTTAYSILRHLGVELGKMDYIGPLSMR